MTTDAQRVLEQGPDGTELENLRATCKYIQGLEIIAQALQNDFVRNEIAPTVSSTNNTCANYGDPKSITEIFITKSYEALDVLEEKLK